MSKPITIPPGHILEGVATLLENSVDVLLIPKGKSMLPFIRGERDSVTLRLLPDVNLGDIVLVRLPGRYVLHRVYDINHNRLLLMGDGNLELMEECTKKDVLGTVVRIHRNGNRRGHRPSRGSLWRNLLPVRRYLLAAYRLLAKL